MNTRGGRGFNPITWTGPITLFCEEFRTAIEPATFREIEEQSGLKISQISECLSGARMPTRPHVLKIAEGARMDADQRAYWGERWDQLNRQMRPRHPPLDHAETPAAMAAAVRAMVHEVGLSAADVAHNFSVTPYDKLGKLVPERATAGDIERFFAEPSTPLTESLLTAIVLGANGRKDDVEHWLRQWRHVAHTPIGHGRPGVAAAALTAEPAPSESTAAERSEGVTPEPADTSDPPGTAASDDALADAEAERQPDTSTPPGDTAGPDDPPAGVAEPATTPPITHQQVPRHGDVAPDRRSTRWPAKRTSLAVGAGAVLAVVVLAAVFLSGAAARDTLARYTSQDASPAAPTPSPSTPPAPLPDRYPHDRETQVKLREIAARTAQSPDPLPPRRYELIHRREFSRDLSSDEPGTAGPGRRGPVVREKIVDDWRFCDAKHEGGSITITVEPDEPPKTSNDYLCAAGEYPLPDKISDDPAVLRQQMTDMMYGRTDPTRWLLAVVALNDVRSLNERQRAAVLTVLADAGGVAYRGPGTTQPGISSGPLKAIPTRQGLAFSADDDTTGNNVREVLIFDLDTGVLLQHETIELDADPARQYARSRTLYVEHGRRDTIATD